MTEAIGADGKKLDLKGVGRSDSIMHIKVVGPDGAHYGVKAISPTGQIYDIKGVKLTSKRVETTVNGVAVFAHVKALPQVQASGH